MLIIVHLCFKFYIKEKSFIILENIFPRSIYATILFFLTQKIDI